MEHNTATGQRIAIVTGGSRGIGRGVVEELTTAGYAAVVGYGSNHAEAEQVVAAAEAKGTGPSRWQRTWRTRTPCPGCSTRLRPPSGAWTSW